MRKLAAISVLVVSAFTVASCGSGEIETRASSTGPVATGATGPTNVPLQDSTWTQEADESDLLLAQISLDSPQNCPAQGGIPETRRTLTIQLLVDGQPLHDEEVLNSGIVDLSVPPSPPPPGGKQFTFDFQASLMKPGSDTNRTLEAQVIERTAVQGCNPAKWSVDALQVDVIGFK
jgi:hypothetical protein